MIVKEELNKATDARINGEHAKMLDEMNELFEVQLNKNENINKQSILKKRELF